MKIAIICGSLRKDSLNKKLASAVAKQAPAGMELISVEWSRVPIFNQDDEQNPPPPVMEVKAQVEAADGIIFVTPEYNRGIPGPLKNLIDWLSRPWGRNSLKDKIVITMGATGGSIGTSLAQGQLKQVLLYLSCRVLGQPEFYLGGATEKFDAEGNLTDEKTKEQITKVLAALSSLAPEARV